jgi:hypothetical protein
MSNPGTISDLLIQTFAVLTPSLLPNLLQGFLHVAGIMLLALPYHAKGIIGDPMVWSRASWNTVPALEKCPGAKAIQHTFSA